MFSFTDALPIIVSNYSHQFGVQIRMQGTEAYTNGRVITIPRLNFSCERAARHAYGYLAHEAAHIRYTDFTQVRKAQLEPGLFYIFNILEDARVEKLIGREFVGVWENLELLREDYNQVDKNALTKEAPLQVMLQLLVVYAASICQGFPRQRSKAALLLIYLRSLFSHRLLLRICNLVCQVNDCKSSAQILTLAHKLLRLLKQHYLVSSLPTAQPAVKSSNLTAQPVQTSCFEQDLQSLISSCSPQELSSRLWLDPAVMLQQASALEDPKLQSARHDFGVFGAADCRKGQDNFILKTRGHGTFRAALAQRLRTYVQHYRFAGMRGYTLLPRKAQLVPLGETSIFKRRHVDEDRKTSVHLLVDVSGSMLARDELECSRGELACISALSLALALEGIDGVKNLCTFFPGISSELEIALKADESATRKAAFFDQAPRGSTPLAQALWYALEQLMALDCERNIVIVITDGIPDSVEKTRQVITVYREAGIELYAIGIKQPFIEDLIKNSVVLHTAAKLEACLFRLIEKIFRLGSATEAVY